MTGNMDRLEREIVASRSKLNASLTDIQDRLHPTAITDELIGVGLRSGAGDDTFRLALDTVRRSPVPVLLICAGVAWLVWSTKRGTRDLLGEEWSFPVVDHGVPQRRTRARIYTAPV